MPKRTGEFTADEVLGELKRRQRRQSAPRAATPGAKARPASVPTTRDVGMTVQFHDLSEVPSGQLAKMLKARQRAIYGSDDRQDTREVRDSRTVKLAEASVALVKAADLVARDGGGFTLRTTSYQREYQLCDREPFAQQPLGCFCSGVLVAPDIIATAGHCLKTRADLRRMRVVFGFRMVDKTRARTDFSEDDVYTPVELVDRVFTEAEADWALLKLDRPVIGRTPVDIRRTGKIGDRDRVFVIGHPCGLPQKVAGGARVRSNEAASHFIANLDTYGGNSGSPVFNESTLQLEGLLVRGQTDFVSVNGCNVSMVFPTTGAGGEEVMRAADWIGRLQGSAPGARNADKKKTARPKRAPVRKPRK